MDLYHLVRTTRMGKNQKKIKKIDPPWCVTLPWFDPYIFETIKMQTWEIWKKGIRIFYEGVFCCLLFGELLGLQLNKLSIAR